MRSVGQRPALLFLLAAITLGLMPSRIVQAEDADPLNTTVSINPATTSPVVTSGTAGYGEGGIAASAKSSDKHAGSSSGSYYSGPVYVYQPIPGNQVPVGDLSAIAQSGYLVELPNTPKAGPVVTAPACPPGETGYYVWDQNGNLVTTVCVPNPTPGGGGPAGPALGLAQQASSQQPWANLVVSMNPATAVTGLPSWFWLAGGSGAIPPASATAGPLTVTVRATLTDVVWDFGDGTEYDSGSSLGQAYPQQSDVSHVYQADTFSIPGGYLVAVSLRYDVSYSVNGGAWTFMGIKARVYSQRYQVNQIQPEGVSN